MADVGDLRYQHHLKHRGRTNKRIFWITWMTIAIIAVVRITRRTSRWWFRRRNRRRRFPKPTTSSNPVFLHRGLAFVKATSIFPLPLLRCIPMPTLTVGSLLLKIFYTAIVAFVLTGVDAPLFSELFVDDIACRAAWVTLTQIPLVYLLSTKRGLLNIVAGVSYERINNIHRWVGRFILLSATTHMAIMNTSISTRDVFHSRDESMTVVRYGIGAYSILAWIAVTSVLPLRTWSYRAFYINHWISTLAFLCIVFLHVPVYARTPIYLAAFFVVFDKLLVAISFCRNNFSTTPMKRRFARFRRRLRPDVLVAGYPIEMTAPSTAALGLPTQTKGTATTIRIRNIPFTWKPGQHVRLYMPALGALEMHPFTPANCSTMPPPPLPPRKNARRHGNIGLLSPTLPSQTSEMLLIIREHSGFTRRLAEYHAEWLVRPCPNASSPPPTLTAYIDGPYGSPPNWELYESLVLIATSSGVSFILAIVDHLEQLCFTGHGDLKTKSITFVWIARHVDTQLEELVQSLLLRYSTILRESDITIRAEFYATCPDSDIGPRMVQYDPFVHLRQQRRSGLTSRPALKIRNPSEIYEEWNREAQMETITSEEVEFLMANIRDDDRHSLESDGISEISTLVDSEGEDEPDEDPFSDAYATDTRDTACQPLLPPPPSSPQGAPRIAHQAPESESCQCAVIQHQRQKLHNFTANYGTVLTRHFSTRPDIAHILSDAVSRTSTGNTMVAACANTSILRDVRSTVAKMNIDFALGRRGNSVEVFIEGFG